MVLSMVRWVHSGGQVSFTPANAASGAESKQEEVGMLSNRWPADQGRRLIHSPVKLVSEVTEMILSSLTCNLSNAIRSL